MDPTPPESPGGTHQTAGKGRKGPLKVTPYMYYLHSDNPAKIFDAISCPGSVGLESRVLGAVFFLLLPFFAAA